MPSVERPRLTRRAWACLAVVGLAWAGVADGAWAAARKSKAARPAAAKPKPAPADTAAPAPVPAAAEPSGPAPAYALAPAAPDPATVTRPLRTPIPASYGALLGIYSTEVVGASPFLTAFWDYAPNSPRYFFEVTLGGGPLQSGFSRSLYHATLYDNNVLVAGEGLFGWTFQGFLPDGVPARQWPFLVGGIAALYQGGTPNLGGVVGFGNRCPLPFFARRANWAFQYGVRDHIYPQRLSSVRPAITNNLVLLLGAQYYY